MRTYNVELRNDGLQTDLKRQGITKNEAAKFTSLMLKFWQEKGDIERIEKMIEDKKDYLLVIKDPTSRKDVYITESAQ